jgi:peptidoglycan/xylan/chitin deacetylase (PgdA/CDA1 family)
MRLAPVILLAAFLATPAAAATAQSCGPVSLGVSRVIEIGPEGAALGLQTYPQSLGLADHELVLTFDDGPAATTPKVLDALAAECVRATFFLVGRNAASSPALVQREIAEGHSVGHHSMTHPARTLRLMDDAKARADIDAGVEAVEKAGYGRANAKPHTPFFRFPGFADTPALRSWLEGRGFTIFGSDLWASDWQTMTPAAELDLVMSRIERAGRGVVLFHDTRPSTAAMLPDFLRRLKAGNYKIVHMTPGASPTPIAKAPAGWTSTTEPIIAKTLRKFESGAKNAAPAENGEAGGREP